MLYLLSPSLETNYAGRDRLAERERLLRPKEFFELLFLAGLRLQMRVHPDIN